LLFALFSGAAADRLDRRRLMVTVNTARALVLLLIFAAVTGGFLTLPLLYLTLFLLGTAETLADTAGSALIVGAGRDGPARTSQRSAVGNVDGRKPSAGPTAWRVPVRRDTRATPDARWSSSRSSTSRRVTPGSTCSSSGGGWLSMASMGPGSDLPKSWL
jgi:Transmembrane secretion effector